MADQAIPQRIRSRREQLGLTQKQAADQAEISDRHWQRFESGERTPTIPMLETIARVLKAELKDLL
jgi:transcriptional regulator with XRE-family HTH domain